jgi:DNA processing protein
MSGYGLATIIVEAGEHSGARIQARVAGAHGRPVILTDRVAATTAWGAAMVERPNVYVVGSLAELRQAINDVREAPARLSRALNELAHA